MLLETTRLAAAYGDLRVLWDISLRVDSGEIVVLIGSNGAGKSTLLRTISGLHRPLAGSISYAGSRVDGLTAHEMVARGVVLVPEGRRLFGGMSVIENLELGAFLPEARGRRAQTLKRVLELFPLLAARRGQRARTMSGGEQQMLAIGRALMSLPRLLLLDEPSYGLAPIVAQQILALMREINRQGISLLLVEQNAHAALELADRAYIVDQGRIAGEGAGVELLHDGAVQQAYLGYAPQAR